MLPAPYNALNPGLAPDGDVAWRGVNERLAGSPASLPEGFCARAKNLRFRNGFPEPRLGDAILPWGHYTNPYGAAVVTDPNSGIETILIAHDGGVSAVRPGRLPVAVTLPETLTADTFCGFVPAFNRVYLLRGDNAPPWVSESLDAGFTALPAPDEAGGLALPNARFGLYFLNRLLAVQGLDYAWASDPGTPAFHLDSIYKVSAGDGDRLQALAAWDKDTLVAFKGHRVFLYTGASGGVATATFQAGTEQYGCLCPRAIAAAGTDLYWLAETGVASLRLTAQNEVQSSALLLSTDLAATFKRVNPLAAASTARLLFDDGYLYCALPLDGSAVNNAVAVFDFQTQAWAGMDEGAALGVIDFLKPVWQGRRQLTFLGTDGYLHLRNWGFKDDVALALVDGAWQPTQAAVDTEFLSRGYSLSDSRRKCYSRLTIQLHTWNPTYTLSVLPDGVGEERAIESATAVTRNPLLSRDFAGAARTADNAGDDQAARGWQDYSLDIPAEGLLLGSGVDPDLHAALLHSIPVSASDHYLQVRLQNTQGRCQLRSLFLEADADAEPAALR